MARRKRETRTYRMQQCIILVFLVICVRTVAPFSPACVGAAARRKILLPFCWPSLHLQQKQEHRHCPKLPLSLAGMGSACFSVECVLRQGTAGGARAGRCQRLTALTSLTAAVSNSGPLFDTASGGWEEDEQGAMYEFQDSVSEKSTATLQRLAAALQEEGSFIEAREEDKTGGRRRLLFRPRQQAKGRKIPEYGPVLVIEPTRQHTATIIWFHDAHQGSHSSPRRWEKRLRAMNLAWCRIVIPSGFHVPRNRTILDTLRGREDRQWYDEVSDDGLAASLQYMQV